MKKWYNAELWEGYITDNLKAFLRMEGIRYSVSDCTPLPRESKYMLHFEIYCTTEEVEYINYKIDVWDEEEKQFR